MTSSCCSAPQHPAGYPLGCHECGTACCSACVIHLESVTYCARCARTLLETTQVRSSGPFGLF